MLKKILVSQLKPGMFIHELCGDWMSHPFWKSKFVATAEDIRRLGGTPIKEVYINASRGLDCETVVPDTGAQPTSPIPVMPPIGAQPAPASSTAFADEVLHAAATLDRALSVVKSSLRDARLGKALDVASAERAVEDIAASVLRNSDAILGLAGIRGKDDYTFAHSVSVCTFMVAFANSMGMATESVRELGVAGLLHDVGKVVVPDSILNKPGKLTDGEFEIIKTHPGEGWKILQKMPQISALVLDVARHHHERLDGRGYPDKLVETEISRAARMATIVDVYDAITAERCYHKGLPSTEALKKMWEWCDGQFDRELLQRFMTCIGIYPVGSLVRLSSGRLGLVIEQCASNPLAPRVKAFFHIRSNCHVPHEIVDLSTKHVKDKIVSGESVAKWRFSPALLERIFVGG